MTPSRKQMEKVSAGASDMSLSASDISVSALAKTNTSSSLLTKLDVADLCFGRCYAAEINTGTDQMLSLRPSGRDWLTFLLLTASTFCSNLATSHTTT